MKALTIVSLIIVLAAGAWFFARTAEAPEIAPSMLTYDSPEYGLTFNYPKAYTLRETDAPGSAMRKHHLITLIRLSDLPLPENGEGPVSISIDVIQNNLDRLTTENWIRNSSVSNFKLSSNGLLTSASIAGEPALTYTWDGLYRGETIAIAREKYIYAFSVTSLSQEDAIRADFARLVETIRFK